MSHKRQTRTRKRQGVISSRAAVASSPVASSPKCGCRAETSGAVRVEMRRESKERCQIGASESDVDDDARLSAYSRQPGSDHKQEPTMMMQRLVVVAGLLLLLTSSSDAFAPAARRVMMARWGSLPAGGSAPASLVAPRSTALRMGLLDGLKKIVGGQDPVEALAQDNEKTLATYRSKVEQINALEDAYEKLSDEQLRARTDEFRRRLAGGEALDGLLVEAFAVVREAAWRVLELRPFDVQLMGGMALHEGRLAGAC